MRKSATAATFVTALVLAVAPAVRAGEPWHHRSGFSASVPSGWTRDFVDTNAECFRSPSGPRACLTISSIAGREPRAILDNLISYIRCDARTDHPLEGDPAGGTRIGRSCRFTAGEHAKWGTWWVFAVASQNVYLYVEVVGEGDGSSYQPAVTDIVNSIRFNAP
jgi:hypothetical protein